jgi:hypothetical protein
MIELIRFKSLLFKKSQLFEYSLVVGKFEIIIEKSIQMKSHF